MRNNVDPFPGEKQPPIGLADDEDRCDDHLRQIESLAQEVVRLTREKLEVEIKLTAAEAALTAERRAKEEAERERDAVFKSADDNALAANTAETRSAELARALEEAKGCINQLARYSSEPEWVRGVLTTINAAMIRATLEAK